jgi:hypothetical protein
MCPCDCELVDGKPRSRATLDNGALQRIGSIREIVTYRCTQCGATLVELIDEWVRDNQWTRTPKGANELT